MNDNIFIFGLPQFFGINFLFDNYYYKGDIYKSLILSELPALFKKYEIPLNKNDIKLYINNIYNIAREYEFRETINSLKDTEKMNYIKNYDNIKYLRLAKEFYEFHKILDDFSDKEDKLIEKLINERYGYYYNKYDKEAYKKFMEFLNNKIPSNGFFEVKETTKEDFEKCKITWIDKKEQRIRDFFYKLKETYPNKPVIFQSIRFYYVYIYLRNKYPEITIEDAALEEIELPMKKRLKAVYVNDIYGDRQYKNNFNHYVVSLPFELKTIICKPRKFIEQFFQNNKKFKYKEIYNEHYNLKRKITYRSAENFGEIIDYLEYERRILELYEIFINSIDGLPEIFIPYFKFCLDNEKQIKYFKSMMNEENNKNKIIEEMINEFGKENMTDILISLLLEGTIVSHELISDNDIKIESMSLLQLIKRKKLVYEHKVKK